MSVSIGGTEWVRYFAEQMLGMLNQEEGVRLHVCSFVGMLTIPYFVMLC